MTDHGNGRLPRVVVVAQAAPALGGIASFADVLVSSPAITATAHMSLLNTTRRAIRTAGRLNVANAAHGVQDAVRVFRASRGADVVHIQAAPGRLLPLLRMYALCVAARAGRARVLCHIHSGRINGGNPEGFQPTRTFRLILRRMGFVQAFLTVSEAGAVALRPLVPAGTTVQWLDNAIDVVGQPQSQPDSDPVRLLFVGTLSRRKGLAELAAAAAALRDEVPAGWSLSVVGGPAEVGEEEAAEMRHEFDARGLQDALLGGRPPADVRDLMRTASVLVLPSHWEGQPMVILEAMACGIPIVSTTVGAIPDVVRDGVDGLLVAPYDVPALTTALRTLVLSPGMRAQMGASARARAMEKYDVSVLSSRLAPLYTGS